MNEHILKAGLVAAALGAMMLPGTAAAQQQEAPHAAWSKVVTKTEAGGYRMGSPDAPVKLVEYASLICGHCAHFHEEGTAPLSADYIDSGRVSFEVRSYTLNVVDETAALLARCGSADTFFPMVDALYDAQGDWWTAKVDAVRALLPEVKALSAGEQRARIAQTTGLDTIASAQGLSRAQISACLSDETAVAELAAIHQTAQGAHGVRGTPTFLIDDVTMTTFNQWPSLKPTLDQMLALDGQAD
ncbi:thioredoxin domain-containing protein [Sphingomicrobium sp. XHP0235]|uniref:thioredoxin domain-containing protein n=1 Tax=Sphingomicrobium aquimarinum TaxID=3133971 RepID=UPI0031FEEF24